LIVRDQVWPASAVPLVSICCITYNHAPYIRESLDGFLMQETDFPIEILIHDDASIDGTADIVRDYAARFPALIKPICQTENQYSKGTMPNVTFNLPRVRGKYIAICEGDDYWTSPRKLQAQVAFLEANPEFSGCFHNVEVREGLRASSHKLFLAEDRRKSIALPELVMGNVIPTLSILTRARYFKSIPKWLSDMPLGDWPFHVLAAQHGPIGYIDEVFGVYRVHDGGVWSSLAQHEIYKKSIVVANAIDRHLEFKYSRAIKRRIAFWHYRAARGMIKAGVGEGLMGHLVRSLRGDAAEVPKKKVLRLMFRHGAPGLYSRLHWRWQRLNRLMRGRAERARR